MFFKKSNRKYGTNFIPPINTPPPEDPPNQYGNKPPQPPPTRIVRDGTTRICHCTPKKPHPKPPHITTYISPDKDERVFNSEPPKDNNSITNTPVKLGKILETIQTGSNSEVLIAAMELLKMCEEREKEPQKENKKGTTNYILVARDEYLLNFIKKFGGNEEKAIESFNNISKGYNFVLAIDENHFYSVDYINKLLER